MGRLKEKASSNFPKNPKRWIKQAKISTSRRDHKNDGVHEDDMEDLLGQAKLEEFFGSPWSKSRVLSSASSLFKSGEYDVVSDYRSFPDPVMQLDSNIMTTLFYAERGLYEDYMAGLSNDRLEWIRINPPQISLSQDSTPHDKRMCSLFGIECLLGWEGYGYLPNLQEPIEDHGISHLSQLKEFQIRCKEGDTLGHLLLKSKEVFNVEQDEHMLLFKIKNEREQNSRVGHKKTSVTFSINMQIVPYIDFKTPLSQGKRYCGSR